MPWLDALFHKMVEVGASDLHMTTAEVPKFRLDGSIVDVTGVPEMTAEQMKHVLDEITPEANRAQFERDGDTDFAYELAQAGALPRQPASATATARARSSARSRTRS